jgi:hypothetical protein
MAALLLVVIPAAVGWFFPAARAPRWVTIPANLAAAWALAFFAAVSVWKDGL